MEDIEIVDLGHDDVDGQESKDGRSRTWMLLLYEDDPTHKAVLDGKLYELDWNFAGRVHDMDEGVKPHHHIVCVFKDGRKKADVAVDLGLDPRWLRAWDKQKKALRYLCHKDNKNKYQYSPDAIYGTLAEKAIGQCSKADNASEASSLNEIILLLNSIEGIVTYNQFLLMVANKGLFSVFRRMGVLGVRLVEEHNDLFRQELQRKGEREFYDKAFKVFLDDIKNLPFDERCRRLEKLGFKPQEGLD